MEIKDLQYFLAVVDAGSMTAASERLFLSQQGLSSAIRRLEDELQYPLLIRSASGVTLTEHGRAFYDGAQPVVSSFQAFLRAMTLPGEQREVSFACVFNVIPKCPLIMQRILLNQDPRFSVSVTECYYSECEKLLEDGQCNFAIVYGPIDETRFQSHTLFVFDQCFVVNKNHPLAKKGSISIQDLRDRPLIIPHKQSRANGVFRGMCRDAGFEPNVMLEYDRPIVVANLVKNNPRIAARMFEPDVLALHDPDLVALHFNDVDYRIKACLLERKHQILSHVERQVMHAILHSASLANPE